MIEQTLSPQKNPLSREDCLSCLEIGKALTSELEPKRFFRKMLQKVSELLPAKNWSLLLLDEKTGELRFEVCVNLNPDIVKDIRLKIGEGIAGQAVLRKSPMIVNNVYENPMFCSTVDRLSGMTTRSIIAVPLVFAGKCSGVIELVNPCSTGERTICLLSVVADYAAIAVENMKRYTQIHDLSIRDNLTGMYNTRYLYQTLAAMISERSASRVPVSLIFMDVDNFKQVVDSYGHLKGSQVLHEIACTIRGSIHEPAFGVAYGGDEFVVVLPDMSKAAAYQKAEDIRIQINETPYLSDYGHNIHVGISLGLASFPEDAGNCQELLTLADGALFQIKVSGKNGVSMIA
ncbi:MAG: sensor domain-containing diguanylate cyclase [Deltaproteobacteria bacterium]|nr:sensor domain-containing diguanylate cyclase [Deltaproteobacteria bacterium]